MSGLLFLTSDDFKVHEGKNGKILCHGIPGFSLILFYSTQCHHCQSLIPVFKRLPGTIGGCQFGMINVSTNKRCVLASQNTIAPITYVPYIVLYVQGKPFMRYNGPYQESELRRFVMEVANKLQSKQRFSSDRVKTPAKGIPEYTIGKPLYGEDNRFYLEFVKAYKK